MIRVNWREINQLDGELRRQGWNKGSEILIDVLFRKPDETKPAKTTVKSALKAWRKHLYQIESNRSVIAAAIKDPRGRVIWQVTEQPHVSEEVPITGHDHVIERFDSMERLQRQAWTKITEASLSDYMMNECVTNEQPS